MPLYSLSQTDQGFQQVEVEVQLVRGIPSLQILGRPEASLKECALRLKTAFQNIGWEWPTHQQIIVNLKPAHLKKQSAGLDLAIALGLRRAQGFVADEFFHSSPIVFGEVDLEGRVSVPRELGFWDKEGENPVLTGEEGEGLSFDTYQIRDLSELQEPKLKPARSFDSYLHRPTRPGLRFSSQAARLLEVTASGEHSLLLAGAAGSGKSVWTEALWTLLPPPHKDEFLKARLFHKKFGRNLKWRPFLQPHHSASKISMVGGGVPPQPGAFTLAHGGVLVLDEYLEFSRDVQEALREPMEKHQVHLFRGTRTVSYPSRFQLLATTNLCPCGDFEPERPIRCGYSLKRCRWHLEKLSGPVVDRFDLLSFTSSWKSKTVETQQIADRIAAATEFRLKRGQRLPNALRGYNDLLEELPKKVKMVLPDRGSSHRRLRSVLRVMRTLADLQQHQDPNLEDLNEAMEWAWNPFEKLKLC